MDLRRGLAAVGALLALTLVGRWLCASRTVGIAAVVPEAALPAAEREHVKAALREPDSAPRERPAPVEPPPAALPAELETEDMLSSETLTVISESELPPDPLESGPASLTLRLLDARSGEPLACRVELWRVDAPENDVWSAGDQLQATVEVPLDGARLANLPEGRYRAACACAAASQELPEFELRAPHTAYDLAVELPLEFELRVHFVDRFGEPYASVEWWEERMQSAEPPSAARNSRSPRHQEGMSWGRSSFAFGFARPRHAQPVAQTADGIDLGSHRGSSRERGLRPVLRLRAPDGALGEVEPPEQGEGVVRLVVVGLPADVAASRVRLPDGRASAAQVEALGLARACSDPALEWRTAPVRLRAELAGFASVDAQWRAADGELPWILLDPAH